MYIDHGSTVRLGDLFIPKDDDNPDYAAYLAWVAEGNTAAPAEVLPPAIPRQVTMRQARLALLAAQKLDLIDTAIASLSSPEREIAHIEWEYGAVVDRSSSIVQMLGAALTLDLDDLFATASTL